MNKRSIALAIIIIFLILISSIYILKNIDDERINTANGIGIMIVFQEKKNETDIHYILNKFDLTDYTILCQNETFGCTVHGSEEDEKYFIDILTKEESVKEAYRYNIMIVEYYNGINLTVANETIFKYNLFITGGSLLKNNVTQMNVLYPYGREEYYFSLLRKEDCIEDVHLIRKS